MSYPQTPLITLTTDFGHGDSYVAQMKGAILGVNPHARLIDVTHSIPPQDCLRASYVLAEIAETFPEGTVHLCVVDPGVGSERSLLAAEINKQFFVVPDNGVLTQVLRRWQLQQIVRLENARYWREGVSATFHGRDIMGPVAAHLSCGVNCQRLGPTLQSAPVTLSPPVPYLEESQLNGEVLWVDTFGNLVTNISEGDLQLGCRADLRVTINGRRLSGISACYADGDRGQLLALFGSSGLLEISANCGNAARMIGSDVGTSIVVNGLPAPVALPRV